MKYAIRLFAFFLAALYVHAQGVNVSPTDPNGSCTTQIWVNQTNGVVWTCAGGTYIKFASSPIYPCGTTCTASIPNATYLFNQAAGSTLTLPASTGSGNIYKMLVTVTTTSAAEKVLTNPVTDVIIGSAIGENGGTPLMFVGNAGTYHSIQMPFTGSQPSGGFKGDMITCTDIATGLWSCSVTYQGGTTPTTPYSSSTS